MKPSIGRIVHFVGEDGIATSQHFAAVVTHVWSDVCVNLNVFPKGDAVRDVVYAGVRTSVVMADTPTANSWHWPEREGE